MATLREDLLDVIAGALPDTPEVLEFCENEFSNMLDNVLAKIKEHIEVIFEEE